MIEMNGTVPVSQTDVFHLSIHRDPLPAAAALDAGVVGLLPLLLRHIFFLEKKVTFCSVALNERT